MIGSSAGNGKHDARGERPRVVFVGVQVEMDLLTRLLAQANLEPRFLTGIDQFETFSGQEATRRTEVVFLDLASCAADGDGAVRAIRKVLPRAILVALAGAHDGERSARLLLSGVPSLGKPVRATLLAELAQRLSLRGTREIGVTPVPREGSGRLEPILARYAEERGLSGQQRTILRSHLAGKNDKQIASDCGCSEATIYEHWRRMARKAGGHHKGCVIVDFHRFLDGG